MTARVRRDDAVLNALIAATTEKTIAKMPAVSGTGTPFVAVTAIATERQAATDGAPYVQVSALMSMMQGAAEVKRMKLTGQWRTGWRKTRKATERKTEQSAPMP